MNKKQKERHTICSYSTVKNMQSSTLKKIVKYFQAQKSTFDGSIPFAA